MKLGSLAPKASTGQGQGQGKSQSSPDRSRDGHLIVIRRDLAFYVDASQVAPTLQHALDNWNTCEPQLQALSHKLEAGKIAAERLNTRLLASPLPRAYEWIDGSAFLSHVERVRAARGAEVPARMRTEPLVYQGGSGVLLAPTDDILLGSPDWGLDFEAEVCVILGDTPMGTTAAAAADHVRLVCLANDVTLRELVPPELEKGFGFFVSKPATAFSPVAVTPDELGPAWRDGRVHLPLETRLNGTVVGHIDAGPGMTFSFFDLIGHITKTRSFIAGTLLGSGTVSSPDPSQGISCLVERRALEKVAQGKPITPWLKVGDHVEIEMRHPDGSNLFGTISQKVIS